MGSDLLTKIGAEVNERLNELRPLVAEYEQLQAAAQSLQGMQGTSSAGQTASIPAKRSTDSAKRRQPARRGSAAGAVKRASSRGSRKRQPGAITAVGQAVIDALEHGSHTVSELVMVTAMSAGDIRGNVRRLLSDGKVAKINRDGKTAYALPSAVKR